MESPYDLNELYKQGHFKEGHSRKADEAIAKLLQVFHQEHFSGGKFEAAWQELLRTLLCEFPDVSTYNLVGIHMALLSRGLRQENLVLYRFIAELSPQSAESQCFLGHAYRDVGDLESAAACYLRAYDLQMSFVTGGHLSPGNPNCLDACDYLCYLAHTENELRRRADAFIHVTRALSMLREVDADHQRNRVNEILHKIFLGMELADLARDYSST